MDPTNQPPLLMGVEEFNAALDRAVCLTKSYVKEVYHNQRPTITYPPSGLELHKQLDPLSMPPEEGLQLEAFSDSTMKTVFDNCLTPSGRYFGYVKGSSESISAISDLLISVMNQNCTTWRSSPIAITVERIVVDWLAQAIGCGGFAGTLTSGGSMSNLMAMVMAKAWKLPGSVEQGLVDVLKPGQQPIIYASNEAHVSLKKAASVIGLGSNNFRLVKCDDQLRLDADALQAAILEDEAKGNLPIAVIGNAGTVNTGAIDPFIRIAEICKAHKLWFHVDGAYGGLAALGAPELFEGLSMADSVTIDPHKWFYQSIDCSCVLYRDSEDARRAFRETSDYIRIFDPKEAYESFAYFEECIELSKRFRAFKVWMSIRYHGMSAFRTAIQLNIAQAKQLQKLVEEDPILELVAPAVLSAVNFRYNPRHMQLTEEQIERLNEGILVKIRENGLAGVSSAVVYGKFTMRVCIVNHRCNMDDVKLVLDAVKQAAAQAMGEIVGLS